MKTISTQLQRLLLSKKLLLLTLTSFILLFSRNANSAIFTVTSLADAGAGTLRDAIATANATAGAPHTINFSVAGTITLASALPSPTVQITIAGNTAPGYAVNAPTISINAGNNIWAILINAPGGANSIIRGLNIFNASGSCIEVNGVNTVTIDQCLLGTNATGTAIAAAGNGNFGISLINSDNNTISNNVISGMDVHGILINVTSDDNIIRGNKIGTNAAGSAAIANLVHGIEINNNSQRTIIGGALAAQRNIISGNGQIGVQVINSPSPQFINNYIGINAAGTGALANSFHGIFLNGSASSQIINNVISGNGIFGLLIHDCNSHIIRGNKVGTNAAGSAALANVAASGISFLRSNLNTIGGTGAGEGNLLSGNGDVGLRFEASNNNTVAGNLIGTDITGLNRISNVMGIFATGSSNITIGGTTSAHRNIISGNQINGLLFEANCNDIIIRNNYIGTNINGGGDRSVIGNGQVGLYMSTNCLRTNVIDNVISGNGRLWGGSGGNGTGIIFANGCSDGIITGNIIGQQADGTTAMGNYENGMVILANCNNLVIGGTTSALKNVVSSNGFQGIVINGSHNIDLFGNYCGTDINGTLARGNGQSGIILIFANNCEVGRAVAGAGNILSNNAELGLHIVGGNGGTVYNNLIGVAANGTTAMGNRNGGVYVLGVAGGTNGSDYIIGGLAANQPNTIAYSTGTGTTPAFGNGYGVGVAHNEQGLRNTIIGNKIFCNVGPGINLNLAGSRFDATLQAGNNAIPAPVITSATATTTTGTGLSGQTIHVYANNTCTSCQGEVYLGTTTVNASGNWSLTHVAVANPLRNTATATTATQGTSQFAECLILPVTLVKFSGQKENETVKLNWSTVKEVNNSHFIIERSSNGGDFIPVGTVAGNGNSRSFISYAYADLYNGEFPVYYRLKQTDFDGNTEYSQTIAISGEENGIKIFPNPAKNFIQIQQSGSADKIEFYNSIGQLVKSISPEKDVAELISVNEFIPGVYVVKIYSEDLVSSEVLVVQ